MHPNRPLIVDIKRHSLEDGPGIRSVVFFKGCPMRCIFCQNPETQDTEAEIVFSERRCIQCGGCAKVCPEGAIDYKLPQRIHRDKCTSCGKCADLCPEGALRLIGRYYPVDEITEILLRDLPFYRHSKGGVTLSGGEPALYPDYIEALLKSLKAYNIHIAIETSGYFDYDKFKQKILPYIDLIYYDIKIADPEAHKTYTGKSNQRIIDNLCYLLTEDKVKVHPRIPLIPNITATRENLSAIVNLLHETGAENVSLLPYNPMGIEMNDKLGRPRPSLPEGFMKPDEEEEVYGMFRGMIEEKGGKNRSCTFNQSVSEISLTNP
ncbi:MAG: glycyl-radical enzyme activating protein [Deltaproteobacteria bacterium]|nr:glycyl-radical enzyme activating protein [Deltaproteobacteria bacterium]